MNNMTVNEACKDYTNLVVKSLGIDINDVVNAYMNNDSGTLLKSIKEIPNQDKLLESLEIINYGINLGDKDKLVSCYAKAQNLVVQSLGDKVDAMDLVTSKMEGNPELDKAAILLEEFNIKEEKYKFRF